VPILSYILTALAAYLLGSIPTGYLAGRARGIDIRTVGSKNMGATNVFRSVGKTIGILVLLVDAFKGWAAVCLAAPWVLHFTGVPGAPANAPFVASVIAGIGAILGHNYTCWLQFKGGKGIATTAGVMLALVPWGLGIALAVWIVLFAATRYVSVASIGAAAVLPFATWFTTHSPTLTVIFSALGALAIYKHKANIQRLRAGTENRISFKKKEPTP